jgi:hypothetical protein
MIVANKCYEGAYQDRQKGQGLFRPIEAVLRENEPDGL